MIKGNAIAEMKLHDRGGDGHGMAMVAVAVAVAVAVVGVGVGVMVMVLVIDATTGTYWRSLFQMKIHLDAG